METKICRVCGNEKPLDDFPKNHQYADGHDTRCKACFNEYQKRLRDSKAARGAINPNSNNTLANFTPRELIEELRARGYKGTLEFTKTITL